VHVHFLDPYRHRSSPVHRLDPRVKFVLTLAFILAVALTPTGSWPVYLLLLSSWQPRSFSDLGAYVLKRASQEMPFVLAALPVIFSTPGEPLVEIPVWSWTLVITQEGLARFISIALKSWISIQAAILLAASTPLPDLLVAMRAVKIPRLLVAIFGDVAISFRAGRRSDAIAAGARRSFWAY
jgi:cobalt/nickel transport system permease protein